MSVEYFVIKHNYLTLCSSLPRQQHWALNQELATVFMKDCKLKENVKMYWSRECSDYTLLLCRKTQWLPAWFRHITWCKLSDLYLINHSPMQATKTYLSHNIVERKQALHIFSKSVQNCVKSVNYVKPTMYLNCCSAFLLWSPWFAETDTGFFCLSILMILLVSVELWAVCMFFYLQAKVMLLLYVIVMHINDGSGLYVWHYTITHSRDVNYRIQDLWYIFIYKIERNALTHQWLALCVCNLL